MFKKEKFTYKGSSRLIVHSGVGLDKASALFWNSVTLFETSPWFVLLKCFCIGCDFFISVVVSVCDTCVDSIVVRSDIH